jgi:hippurate hydrolase
MPHMTADVIPAAAQLVLALQTIVSRETDPMAAAVISVTNLNAGSGADNVISGEARLTGTVRTFRNDIRDHIEARMSAVVAGIAAAHNITAECTYKRLIDPTINDPEATLHCQAAAAALAGEDNVLGMEPIMGGEDFGGFLEVRPGAFMAVGQGETPDSPHSYICHSPLYDFNDAIIPTAAEYFAELAERRLPAD